MDMHNKDSLNDDLHNNNSLIVDIHTHTNTEGQERCDPHTGKLEKLGIQEAPFPFSLATQPRSMLREF